MPSPNMPLWPKDYFELKEVEKKHIQEKLSNLAKTSPSLFA